MQSVCNKRSISADLLKGIGIFLVIIGHMTYNSSLGCWIYAFHMPLFFILSGVFFKPSVSNISRYAKRLLVPYFMFAIFSYIYWRFLEMRFRPMPEEIDPNMHALDILWQRDQFRFNVPLWFLPCLFFVQTIACVLFSWVKKLSSSICLVVIWFIAACFNSFKIDSMWMSEALYAFPFFGVGYLLGKDRFSVFEGTCTNAGWHYTVLSLLLFIGLWFIGFRNDMMDSHYALGYGVFFAIALIAFACCFLIATKLRNIRWLVWLGENSLAVMCLHEPLKRLLIVAVSKVVSLPVDAVRVSILLSIIISVLVIVILVPFCMLINKKCSWVLGK